MKKADATCNIEVYCVCPHCDAFEDVFEDVREEMDEYHQAKNCNVEVTCSECGKNFIVENIIY